MNVAKAVRCRLAPHFVRQVLNAAWSVVGAGRTGSEVTVRITGDRELRRLNREFLGHDEPTDVLSFPAEEDGYLGDLAISWPAVVRQSAAYGHPEAAELALLLVHGLLHLLGRDHATADEERAMWDETRACLREAAVEIAVERLAPAP